MDDDMIMDDMFHSERNSDVGQFQPKSLQDFVDVMNEAKAVFDKVHLSEEVNSYYKKRFSDIQSLDTIDLKDSSVLKSFLAFKKLIKYKDEVSIEKKADFFDETSPFLGEYSQYHEQLKNKSFYLVLEDALYRPEITFYMIPQEDREKANALGDEMLRSELAKYNTTPEEIFSEPVDYFKSVTNCCDIDNPYNDWSLQICLDNQKSQIEGEEYAPLGVVALHELGHVRQTMPGLSEHEFNKKGTLAELAPTIDLIVRQDEIYKKIHNIPLEQKVAYPKQVLIADNPFEIGEIANTFRQIKQKYNFDNFEQVLLTKDAEEYVSKLTGLQKGTNNHDNVNEQSTNRIATLRKMIAHDMDFLGTKMPESDRQRETERIMEKHTKKMAIDMIEKVISDKKVKG